MPYETIPAVLPAQRHPFPAKPATMSGPASMRIGSRIFLVGSIPIVLAVGIAVAAIVLLHEANRARSGAALAGTVFRTLLTAVMARNEFLQRAPESRFIDERRFFEVTTQASDDLKTLRTLSPDEGQATLDAEKTLAQYVEDMRKLVGVTAGNDAMVANMRERAMALIGLTDQARERQHASNADIVSSLSEGDIKLRAARDIVDAAYAARLAIAAIEADLFKQQPGGRAANPDENRRVLSFNAVRLKQSTANLLERLKRDDRNPSDPSFSPRIDALATALSAVAPVLSADDHKTLDELAKWSDQILKIYSAEYRSFHEEAAQLLTYSVQAHDTELATQNIAIEALKLGNLSDSALGRRDESASKAILAGSRGLTDTMAALPIAPLIQSEMIEAFKKWHDALQTATTGIRQQNDLLGDMDSASAEMIKAARSLDVAFSSNAERTARSIRTILIFGAAIGVLLGGGAAFLVARSITRPLADLQARIMYMAQDHVSGLIRDDGRRDELGDIARATNTFLSEIAQREQALRKAKDQADATLETLRRTQAELIQAEKLASLGQLVAGVAHEINTPIGIALTTSTVVDEEARRFRLLAQEGKISRSALDRLVERVAEGASLLSVNLTRAAELIQSFKHVAADQVSGERREFDMQTFLHQLLTSLGPMLRRTPHTATMECPPDLLLDSHPGALAQVVTNLVVNASLHAFDEDQAGRIVVTANRVGPDLVRLVVSDDGHGIAPHNRAKIFDPFFTTRRSEGSTGLGLHIVFNIVTGTLQGRIELAGSPGGGTRFIVDLPQRLKAYRPSVLEQETFA